MSDFDKEAEREKLREQFAEDKHERQNTQRMSELLLKGATMTDTHCDTCGDPIFRWDGQEFCPTCSAGGEGAATGAQQAQAPADAADADPEPEPGASPAPDPDHDHGPETGVEVDVDVAGESDGTASETSQAGTDREAAAGGESAAGRDPTGTSAQSTPGTASQATDRTAGSRPAADDLEAARGSLVRTLTRFASEAEGTANPADAREQLAAVEAAADALAALRRAER